MLCATLLPLGGGGILLLGLDFPIVWVLGIMRRKSELKVNWSESVFQELTEMVARCGRMFLHTVQAR